ncbi:MAG: KTSC domain-containing protein [Thermoanaerobaculia bacterium]|nr:KTSC domain-containing protein [Thermoanaerobaculia bacterium]
MDWINTPNSSNLSRFAYDSEHMILTVEFKRGGTYNYYDVPEGIFELMKTAQSHGRALAQNVKGIYRYARI